MQLIGEPKIHLREEAKDFLNLYASLGERAENFLPDHVLNTLRSFVRVCYEEPIDPAKQIKEIDKYILELNELIPGYVDVSLMIFPHENSKAFEYSAKRQVFRNKLNYLYDTESLNEVQKRQTMNLLNMHDFSVGTPPVTAQHLDLMYKLLLGEDVRELRKFRDIIGITGDIEEAQWNYFLDVLDQMVNQSSHYTTKAERDHFLSRSESTVNFKGLNGFIRTFVSGTAATVIQLISREMFVPEMVKIIQFKNEEDLFEQVQNDTTSIFVVVVKNMRRNMFNNYKWFPVLSRLIIVDDSLESRSTNTSLVFCFHNKIINTLNKVHTKKLGALANTQVNLRLILDKVNTENLTRFRDCANKKIKLYEEELKAVKMEQLGDTESPRKDIMLFRLDDFAKQIIKDKYTLTRLRDYIELVLKVKNPAEQKKLNKELLEEYEQRTLAYFYSNNPKAFVTTVIEGGGRNQIRIFGEYLLQHKLKPLDDKIVQKCKTIINIIPNNYQRTLHGHFHKHFGINLFLEKYKAYLTKLENEADNRGRFRNFLIDLGIVDAYDKLSEEEKNVVKEFLSGLANLEKTSISDDVQMIIRDLLLYKGWSPKPYVLFNQKSSWEYRDLFPEDRFDINPFDIDIELNDEGRIDYARLQHKLSRIKSTFQLFDETGNLWDRFCENTTIIINDPMNPTGYSDFNSEDLIKFLKFLNNCKITLFLDEAYNDGVKVDDPDEPKWRIISRYVMNNVGALNKINIVSSLSTTKNLAATGNRLGILLATPARKDVITYARKQYGVERGNTNSLYMLVNTIELAQLAKKVKDSIEEQLPKNASRSKIKKEIEDIIINEIYNMTPVKGKPKNQKTERATNFEGSPLHIFLLNELTSLDKLDVLELPDDFKYKGDPFFSYYKKQIVFELNKFRVNKNFRNESNVRLKIAKEIARQITADKDYLTVMESDGSYLFNIVLKDFFSYQDLEKFTKKIAEQRGIAAIPYRTGSVRFSLGYFVEGTDESYLIFRKEFENALTVFLKYWEIFHTEKNRLENKDKRTEDILDYIFKSSSDKDFIIKVLEDFSEIRDLAKSVNQSIKINMIKTLYHASPSLCGVNINTIHNSKNSVFEFSEKVGQCRDVVSFIESMAFTKVYENLLPQIYKRIPLIKYMDIHSVIAKYGKATLLKYIDNKLAYQPNGYVLDDPDEKNIMMEILIEMEKILFSDAKVKIMALDASHNSYNDLVRLEGVNRLLKKHVEELLLHFNLPFAKESAQPGRTELVEVACEKFEEIVGLSIEELNLENYVHDYVTMIVEDLVPQLNEIQMREFVGPLYNVISEKILRAELGTCDKLLYLYLLYENYVYQNAINAKLANLDSQIAKVGDNEVKMFVEQFAAGVAIFDFATMIDDIYERRDNKVAEEDLSKFTRKVVQFFIDILNRTKHTEYFNKYIHTLIVRVETEFRRQNSSINEMVQHGLILHQNFAMENGLDKFDSGRLNWINDVMTKCGVIASEQSVQTHTRIVTDAKKREFPFHQVDRALDIVPSGEAVQDIPNPTQQEYIKHLDTRPSVQFFANRVAQFVENMDVNDYRCKIVRHGIVNELYIIQKAFMKYLTDNFRLLQYEEISLEEVKKFVPDIVVFYGAPEKVISFPQVGYFSIPGPNGDVKVLMTPLKKKGDYFGNIKKPRLTIVNEKVKEMGGVPVHGSMFALELDDGSLFVIEVDGDSGVGKSEMLAAMMLKWLKNDLPGIRSIKQIAGDMFHVFPDTEGNLYGIGTEVGDFSRVTDFDPDFIKYYNSLFASSADSNVTDLNARATVSGLCDISMPFRIDIILTAQNYARDEAGVRRYENPANFMLYRHSHGERKEKATSSDNPNFQRTLDRYTGDKDIVELIGTHGNYLDDILSWEKVEAEGKFYLCSSYKLMDKIDIEYVVNKIFKGKEFYYNNPVEKERTGNYVILDVKFDIIKNRFVALCNDADAEKKADDEKDEKNVQKFLLDRTIFSNIFDSLASTPAGQPFISEAGQLEGKKHLINILKGGEDGKGAGRKIRLGILSTDLGRKGKEITGPQKAAEELMKMIQEVRVGKPEINALKNKVRNLIEEKYSHIFVYHKRSPENFRYNFYLAQLHEMKKAEFVRIDDLTRHVDIADRLQGFVPVPKTQEFSPLLVTPNINTELNGFTETYEQLMSLPNNPDFAEEFYQNTDKLYEAEGYSEDTIINNMVMQLLIMNGYIGVDDINRGRITEKVNRETLAAAKYAVIRRRNENKASSSKGKSVEKKADEGKKE